VNDLFSLRTFEYLERMKNFIIALCLIGFLSACNKKSAVSKSVETQKHSIPVQVGEPSPGFAFENVNGETTELKDFLGKYVLIKVWASWCAPCKAQIPFQREIEAAYEGKDIAFVNVAVDKQENIADWRDYVTENKLSGVHVISDKSFDSDFVKAYGIKGIPRFILVDPEGKVVSTKTPFPAEKEKLIAFLDDLEIK